MTSVFRFEMWILHIIVSFRFRFFAFSYRSQPRSISVALAVPLVWRHNVHRIWHFIFIFSWFHDSRAEAQLETPLRERDHSERDRERPRRGKEREREAGWERDSPPRKIKARRSNKWSEWVFWYLSIWYFGSNRCNLLPSCWAWTWAFVSRSYTPPLPLPPLYPQRISAFLGQPTHTDSYINGMHK